jgi:hypothetical protein
MFPLVNSFLYLQKVRINSIKTVVMVIIQVLHSFSPLWCSSGNFYHSRRLVVLSPASPNLFALFGGSSYLGPNFLPEPPLQGVITCKSFTSPKPKILPGAFPTLPVFLRSCRCSLYSRRDCNSCTPS